MERVGMEEMEHEGGQSLAVLSSCRLSARLKLVGENLETIKEFSEPLIVKLTPNPCQNTCIVEFLDGQLI